MVMLTKNFSRDEMSCPCCGKCQMTPRFIERLQDLRDTLGRPMVVTSGYRCEVHNVKVGGAVKSFHLLGRAADTPVRSGREMLELVEAALIVGFTGIGIAKNFVHLDDRDDPLMFTY